MKLVALIVNGNGQPHVLVEQGADVQVTVVNESEPRDARLQVVVERAPRDEILSAIEQSMSVDEPPAPPPAPPKPAVRPEPRPEFGGNSRWVGDAPIGAFMLSLHARLRWLERVMGVDVEAPEREILTDSVRDAIRSGATGIVIGSWWLPVAQPEGRIKTVVPIEWRLPSSWRLAQCRPKWSENRWP